jgi:histidinol dehydrogenase
MLVLAAAYVAGVTRAFTIGGAQAVAALAYGTATIPKVDKITGPGNAYVAAAKRRVFGTVGIDMIAGPSEILVLADGSTPPTGWPWICSARPSTTNWRKAFCCARMRRTSTRCRRDRPPAARHATRRHHRQKPQRPRRADPHPQHGRGLCPQQPYCARAPGGAAMTPIAGNPCSSTPVPSFWGPTPASRWVTTALVPTTCCPPAARRVSRQPAGCVRFPEAQQPDRSERSRCPDAWAPIAAELAYGEGLQAHARAAEMRMKK